MDAAVDFAAQQPGRLEDTQVLGNGGKRDVEGLGQFADGGLTLSQAREDGATSGIGERAEGGVQKGACSGRIVNHMV